MNIKATDNVDTIEYHVYKTTTPTVESRRYCAVIVVNDNVLSGHMFFGSMRAEAAGRAADFWTACRGRPPAPVVAMVERNPVYTMSRQDTRIESVAAHGVGRGAGLRGTIWLGNPKTKEKRRFDAAQADSMMSQGWIKAGPRTKL